MARTPPSRPKPKPAAPGNYFAQPKKANIQFIASGCCLLDCSLGGGWPLGRMSNIIGDKSSGKTLLAIEAMTNFQRQYQGNIFYLEAEAAFDDDYAAALGMPVDAVTFVDEELPDYTIEAWFEHLDSVITLAQQQQEPVLYIVDSLDALSDKAEKERAIGDSSYGMTKQKKLGELFRRQVKAIEKTRIHLMIISQIRDNVGVMFGHKHIRTGGRAMDFYASHCVWLTHTKQLDRTINKVKRTTGVQISAEPRKNKVALPFRKVEFPVLFGYGIDDVTSMLNWLDGIGQLAAFQRALDAVPAFDAVWSDWRDAAKRVHEVKDDEVFRQVVQRLEATVLQQWLDVETRFLPSTRKYR